MLNATIDGKLLGDIVSIIKSVTWEIRFHITEKGIWCKSVDTSNAMLISMNIPPETFNEFVGTPSEMCLDTDRLSNVIGVIETSDPYKISYSESVDTFRIQSKKTKYETRCIMSSTVRKDPTYSEPPIEASFNIASNILSSALLKAASVEDKIYFDLDPDKGFTIYTMTEPIKEGKPAEESFSTTLDVEIIKSNKITSLFSSDYIRIVANNIMKSEKTTVELMGNDQPIKFTTVVGKEAMVSFMIAPRIS